MGNALDYISWRGDLSFKSAPVNEVDIFIFAQIIAPDYSGLIGKNDEIKLKDASEDYFETHNEDKKNLGVLQSEYVLPALKAMSRSSRYKNLILKHYIHKVKTSRSEQFCGMSIEDPGNFLTVVFQGTDDTIIGWKEDFELAAKDIIPSHLDAVNYLTGAVSESDAKKIYVTGHSKGGNLALYSAVNCERRVRDRITTAVSFDGPGFRDEFFKNENYAEMKNRLVTVLSDHSFVGLLLKRAGRRVIVKSSVIGPLAHDGFYWEVMGPSFKKTSRLSRSSQKIDKILDEILLEMNEQERLNLTEELFSTILSTGAVTITDLMDLNIKEKAALLKKISQTPQLSAFLKVTFNSLLNS